MFTKGPVSIIMKANASDYQSRNYHVTQNFAQLANGETVVLLVEAVLNIDMTVKKIAEVIW